MGKVKLPYYVVKRGKGYWQPTSSMQKAGARPTPCGDDGPAAWAIARTAYDDWQVKCEAEEKRPDRIAEGTLAAAFAEYRQTQEWAVKAVRTREEWERCWAAIGPAFGPCPTHDHAGADQHIPAHGRGQRLSARGSPVHQNLARSLADRGGAQILPARRGSFPRRSQRRAKAPTGRLGAWRGRAPLQGRLAGGTQGPGGCDGRRLGYEPLAGRRAVSATLGSQRRHFQRRAGQDGRAAIGTLSRRSLWALDGYLPNSAPMSRLTAPIFRNRSGRAYSKDTLGDDFRDVRALVFGLDERRTLADFRRSGTVEAIRGGAEGGQIAAKMANQFDKSAFLRKTYAPVDLQAVRAADEARKRGRKQSEQSWNNSNFRRIGELELSGELTAKYLK